MNNTITVCGLIGSLRAGSFNRGLMHAAIEIGKEEGVEIHLFDRLREIPLYDQDQDIDGVRPESVEALKAAIRDADALLIATPEYNYSIPGVLKNAIDWASRPPNTTPLKGKPAALMGASMGMGGTIRAQLHLRHCFVFTQTLALLQPEVLIPRVQERFDSEGKTLTDESTRELLRKQLRALAEWKWSVWKACPSERQGVGGV
jgi:chromate reductase, NAD(P)H dehydrogenase (quinone)